MEYFQLYGIFPIYFRLFALIKSKASEYPENQCIQPKNDQHKTEPRKDSQVVLQDKMSQISKCFQINLLNK